MAKTIYKSDIVEDLQYHDLFADATKGEVADFVDDFFEEILNKVADGTSVSIARFGKFEAYKRQNGTLKPKFTPFKDFKDAVSQ